MEIERYRTDAWIRDLIEKCQSEKNLLEEKMYRLEAELHELRLSEQRNLRDDSCDEERRQSVFDDGVVGARGSSTRSLITAWRHASNQSTGY